MATKDVNIAITASDKTGSAFAAVQRNLGSLKSSATSVTSAIGKISGVFAAIGATAFVKNILDSADSLAKLSQKTGYTVESLSAMTDAASLAGVSQEQLATGINKFNRSIVEASIGTTAQKNAFDALGISVRDSNGNLKSSESLLGEVADAFANSADGAGKGAAAVALFGKAGAELIPLLNTGSAGLKQYGNTFSTEFALKAEKFNDSIELLVKSFKRLTVEALPPLINGLQSLIDQFNDGIKAFGSFSGALRIGMEVNPFKNYQENIAIITEQIKELEKQNQSAFTSKWAIEESNKRIEYLKKVIVYLKERAQAEALGDDSSKGHDESLKRRQGLIKGIGTDTKKEIEMPNERILSLIEAQKLELLKVTDNVAGVAKMTFLQALGYDKLNEKEKQQLSNYVEMALVLDKIEKSKGLDALIKQIGEKEVDRVKKLKEEYQNSLDPISQMAEKLNKLDLALKMGEISWEEYGSMLFDVIEKTDEFNKTVKEQGFGAAAERGLTAYYNSIKDISDLMEDSVVRAFNGMEDAFVNFVKTGKLEFKDLANSVINDIIRIQVRQSITEPLSKVVTGGAVSGFIGNLFSSQSASVDPIGSGLWSYAGGGYTGSGSRSGGVDGMGGFPAILHPNETVVDHSAGQGAGVTVNQTINLSAGVSQTVRAEVMGMMPRIMEATKSAVADAKRRGGSFGRAMA